MKVEYLKMSGYVVVECCRVVLTMFWKDHLCCTCDGMSACFSFFTFLYYYIFEKISFYLKRYDKKDQESIFKEGFVEEFKWS